MQLGDCFVQDTGTFQHKMVLIKRALIISLKIWQCLVYCVYEIYIAVGVDIFRCCRRTFLNAWSKSCRLGKERGGLFLIQTKECSSIRKKGVIFCGGGKKNWAFYNSGRHQYRRKIGSIGFWHNILKEKYLKFCGAVRWRNDKFLYFLSTNLKHFMHFQGNLLFPHWRCRHARHNPIATNQLNTARFSKKIIQENEYFRKPMGREM